MLKTRFVLAFAVAVAACPTAMAKTQWAAVGEGRLEIKNPDLQFSEGDVPSVVPLRHTDVDIKVRGFVAEVSVTQKFENVLDRPIEAEYVFPLPHDAAVNATEMRIGKRIIRGRIDTRDAARQKYEHARDEGKRASLLEQERPNIFTQSVANIAPNEAIEVVIRYVQTLPYLDGRYEVVFPMVVGPRYIPGVDLRDDSGNPMRSGHGRLPDTDRVADASRVTPHVLKPDERCGFDISVSVDIDAGVPIGDLRCRSHRVKIRRLDQGKAAVSLDSADRIPNKDFVLEIEVAGQQPEVGFLAHHNGKGGYFTLVLQPSKTPTVEQIRPREIICVMDVSGSMHGQPIELAKRCAIDILKSLRPTDRFNVYIFSNRARSFQPDPILGSESNVSKGIRYVRSLRAGGGTEMLKGVRAALSKDLPEGYMRIIVFLTDGYIGNENEIISEIQKKLGQARLFSFGVGSSVNRYLLERMAVVGRGAAGYVLLNDKPEQAMQRFIERIAKPVLTDVSVTFGGLQARELTPSPIPDVFAGMPVYIHGRYDQPGQTEIEVTGRIGIQPSATKLQVNLPGPSKDSSPLPSIWARQRIKELELEKLRARNPLPIEKQITALALEYSLMSAYTSFIAVDETPTKFGGRPKLVPVAVPIPEGVNYETTVGEPYTPGPGANPGGGGGGSRFGGGPIGLLGFVTVGVTAVIQWFRKRRGDGLES